jgi:hypothetical protein
MCCPAEKVHLDYLRIMAGAGKRVKQLLLYDFARSPVSHHWVALAVRWWETVLLECNSGCMATRALRDDVQFMLFAKQPQWVQRLLVLQAVAHPYHAGCGDPRPVGPSCY